MTAPTLEIHLTDADPADALYADARRGLSADPKSLPPKWFYDARGSELFEEITGLPEYYPTRTERALLERVVGEIAARTAAEVLVELGSGSSAKTRLLLSALTATGPLKTYVPQDVSESALRGAGRGGAEFPAWPCTAWSAISPSTWNCCRPRVAAAWSPSSAAPSATCCPPSGPNSSPASAALEPGEQLLIGAGLVIDPAVLVPAYDDAAGVTAEFNRNVLHVLNSALRADFDVDAFDHVARVGRQHEWIEMRLRACRAMTVRLPAVDMTVHFAKDEEMRTEVSRKVPTRSARGRAARRRLRRPDVVDRSRRPIHPSPGCRRVIHGCTARQVLRNL